MIFLNGHKSGLVRHPRFGPLFIEKRAFQKRTLFQAFLRVILSRKIPPRKEMNFRRKIAHYKVLKKYIIIIFQENGHILEINFRKISLKKRTWISFLHLRTWMPYWAHFENDFSSRSFTTTFPQPGLKYSNILIIKLEQLRTWRSKWA